MAILPKSSPYLVTVAAWAQSTQEKAIPAFESAKAFALSTAETSKAILDRYPPLKVFSLG
jgi:hypothetical protein